MGVSVVAGIVNLTDPGQHNRNSNIISGMRKRSKANNGVRAFFKRVANEYARVFFSVVTVGELRRGVELIRHRGDHRQVRQLEKWLDQLLAEYAGSTGK